MEEYLRFLFVGYFNIYINESNCYNCVKSLDQLSQVIRSNIDCIQFVNIHCKHINRFIFDYIIDMKHFSNYSKEFTHISVNVKHMPYASY